MRTLSLDIETYSSADLSETGVYRYVEAPDFEILLIGYSFDGGPVQVHDCTGPHSWPKDLMDALVDPDVLKTAWNASFERTCIAAALEEEMPPEQWSDTMVLALELGLPGALAAAGAAIGLPEDKLKDPVGKSLIQYFSKPCRPTKANGGRVRNLPYHDPEKWKLYIEYNRQDVVTEMAIRERLSQFPFAESEQRLWCLDQKMNDHGVMIDVPMVEKIVAYDNIRRQELQEKAQMITGLANPNSLTQLKDWLNGQGMPMTSITKETIDAALSLKYIPETVREVLEIRQALGKTSTAKYSTMLGAVCSDGWLRGILQFYGANRSGRWAGRLVQTHNLARNSLPDLDLARELAVNGDFDTMQTLFGETAFVFSELVRTAFIPSPGCQFVVSDFSAIEARVISWLAGEEWRIDAFRDGKDIYCETASQMYHVPVVKHGVNGELRQRGKVAELACIAKGQLVLTDQGLIPIEKVTTRMKLWDGIEWVHHDGVISKGMKRTISYGGLEATEDHVVWAKVRGTYRKIQFGEAATSRSCLVQSGSGRKAIRLAKNYFSRTSLFERLERMCGIDRMHGMRTKELDTAGKHDAGKNKRVSELQSAKGSSTLDGSTIHSCKTTMRESERPWVQKLWSAWNKIRFSKCNRRLPVHDQSEWDSRQRYGNRPNRCKWELCSRKSTMGDAPAKLSEPKEVFDILNAGPRHRFTVSNVLVHNCGYQGGVGAMRQMDKSGTIPEEELQAVVDQWRAANPKIVKLWRDYETAAKTALKENRPVKRTHGIVFSCEGGNLFIQLPSGRRLCYWHAKADDRVTYMGVNQTTKQWGEIETYGGKLVENIVQAIARDCLAEAMKRVDALGYDIVMHVHDEMIVDVPAVADPVRVLAMVNEAMGAPIDWAPGLPLKGDGYITDFYRKD